MGTLSFDGRVVIVTGAGRGIGLSHARLFAERGARVVINDLGRNVTGAGEDASRAEEAARSIVESGGEAIANSSDVASPEGAQALVDLALSQWGRVDVVVNNAGHFDNDVFPDTAVGAMLGYFNVHAGGSYNVTRAAWPALVESGAGRVVMTTSAGALGHAEMVGYSAAKAGVIGLVRSLAMVGEPVRIKVNAIAPLALTSQMNLAREHAGQAPLERDDSRRPELVSPLVALLAHESCPTTGDIFNSGRGRYSRFVFAECAGYVGTGAVTPEEVRDHWHEVTDTSSLVVAEDTMSWSAHNAAALEAATPGRPSERTTAR